MSRLTTCGDLVVPGHICSSGLCGAFESVRQVGLLPPLMVNGDPTWSPLILGRPRMTTVARAVAVGVTVALMCAPALAQKVAYDFHRNQAFSQLRTFSIRDTPPAGVYASRTTIYDGPIVRQNTNAAVAAQL